MPNLKINKDDLKTLQWVFDNNMVTDWSLAVDGGAYAGEWTREMAKRFGEVHSFEPTPETFTILSRRVRRRNVTLYNKALLDRVTKVETVIPPKRSTLTARQVAASEQGEVDAVTIDSMGFKGCGLIKLDLEGAELLALKGARKTVHRCRPVLIIEVSRMVKYFGARKVDIMNHLEDIRYRLVYESGVDKVFVPR